MFFLIKQDQEENKKQYFMYDVDIGLATTFGCDISQVMWLSFDLT